MTEPGQPPLIQTGALSLALGDRYTIKRVIARGGMAIIYLAEDKELGRQVAIKLLDPERSSHLSAERFLREVRITAQLQHPNILPLIDSGRLEGLVYAVMPYVEGESLRDLLLREPRVPQAEALLWAREIAEALEYAHQRGIVHRDIKPENILLSNGQAVISDFGVAYARHLASQGALTGIGETLGTPAYMSPEQIRGEKVDGRSDVYSLGCMLYEMLTGRPPFDEPSVRKVLNLHLNTEATPVEVRNPDVPERIAQIVRKAMAKKAADRYETAGAMGSALRRVLGEPPRHSTPSGPELASQLPATPTLFERVPPSGAGGWLVLGALALLGAVIFLPKEGGRGSRTPAAPVGIAVIAPRVEPRDAVPPYLAEGLVTEVIGVLTRYRMMRVTPASSSLAPGIGELPPVTIGDTLGVTSILASTVSPEDERYRVTVRLLRASDGSTDWQRSYQFTSGNLGSVARQIGQDAAAELSGGTVTPIRSRDRAANLSASVLEGRYWMARGTPEAMAKARQSFSEAVALDTNSVEALAGLANTRLRAAAYGYRGPEDFYSSVAAAIHEARRAVRLDSMNAEARFVAARAARFAGEPRDSVAKMYEAALALSPNMPDALIDLAQLVAEQDPDSAIALVSSAIQLTPLAPFTRHGAITVALRARRYDFAIEQARSRLAQDPADIVALALEGLALTAAGRSTECAGRAFGPWLAAEAACLHAAGRKDDAIRAADSLRHMLDSGNYATVHQFTDLGTYYAWTGNGPEALAWIRKTAERTPFLIDWVFTSGLYDPVLRQPAFRDGLQGIRKSIRERLMAQLEAAPGATPVDSVKP